MTSSVVPRSGPMLHGGRMSHGRAALGVAGGIAAAALLTATGTVSGGSGLVLSGWALGATGYLVAAGTVEGRRRAVDRLVHLLLVSAVGLCLVALGAVLIYTISRGLSAIRPGFFTHSMNGVGPLDTGGGAYHAVLGTVEQVLLATVLSVPAGVLMAVYLNEYGRQARLARTMRAVVDVMTGIPSVVAGLFIYAFWVLGLHQGFSGLAAAMALSVLMLPIVVRSAEEILKLVPESLREASLALGIPRWRTILSVVLPTASAGLTTGVVLAVARVAGETAPLLLTAFGFDTIHTNPLHGAQSALPLFVFSQASSAFAASIDRAWAGALTLIVLVLVLTIAARLLTRRVRA
ncbi:MAG: phosphate ABC transporter permease PstA [Acidimicrobiales bacterium]